VLSMIRLISTMDGRHVSKRYSRRGEAMADRRSPLVLSKRKIVDVLALVLSLGLVLGVSILGIQKHAAHELLAKASTSLR
jgi:hypothetical protein